jgi:predicted nucleic acid-binding protein
MKRNRLYVDTGAWIALTNTNDQYHQTAIHYYRGLELGLQLVTSSHVIAETYTWLRYRVGHHSAYPFLSITRQAILHGRLQVFYDDEDLLEVAEQCLADFPDQKLSYPDAISIALMKREGISKVFSFDYHFHIVGFEVVPARKVT